MKYYIRKTTWSDILLLTLTEEPKTDSGLSQFKLKSVLYDSGGNYSSGYLLRYDMKQVIEFDSQEEAIAWAALEVL